MDTAYSCRMDKTLYTVIQAARAIGVSKQALYERMSYGRVTASCHDVDGRPLFTEADVEKLRQERERRTKR